MAGLRDDLAAALHDHKWVGHCTDGGSVMGPIYSDVDALLPVLARWLQQRNLWHTAALAVGSDDGECPHDQGSQVRATDTIDVCRDCGELLIRAHRW